MKARQLARKLKEEKRYLLRQVKKLERLLSVLDIKLRKKTHAPKVKVAKKAPKVPKKSKQLDFPDQATTSLSEETA